MYRPDAEGTLENPIQLGAEGARRCCAESLRQKDGADNVELASQMVSARINSEIEIVPQRYRDRRKAKGNERPPVEYRPLIKGQLKLDDVLVNMPTVPELGEGESNFGLDLLVVPSYVIPNKKTPPINEYRGSSRDMLF